MATVLVVDVDPLDLDVLSFLFKQDGHRVFATPTVREAVELLQRHAVDVITIEPAGQAYDGVRLCQRIRQLNPWTPLVIVSQQRDVDQVVRSLMSAADDYVRKPFSPHELLARVRALLRRSSLSRAGLRQDDTIAIGDITLDQHRMAVTVRQTRVSLTPRELSLLRAFMENPDRVLSREQLMELAWGDGFVAMPKAVDVYVLRLRKKIRPLCASDFNIKSLRGFGYIFMSGAVMTQPLDDVDPQSEDVVSA